MPNTPESIVRALIESPRWPRDSIGYHELQGYLFALVCAPEPLPPAAWLRVAGPLKRCANPEEIEEFSNALMAVFDSITAAVIDERMTLPDDCVLREPALANFEETAPVALWSRGFAVGHILTRGACKARLPNEFWAEFDGLRNLLGFFGSRTMAEGLCEAMGIDVPEMAGKVVEYFPTAISSYAYYGRMLQLPILDQGVGVASNKAAIH